MSGPCEPPTPCLGGTAAECCDPLETETLTTSDDLHTWGGGAGGSCVDALEGNDKINPGPSAQSIFGGPGSDILKGGPEGDLLYGGSGDDELKGGPGCDLLAGQDGSDTLDGGPGNDLLIVGSNGGDVKGGSGDDIIVIQDACIAESTLSIDGGSGTDVVLSPLTESELLALGVQFKKVEEILLSDTSWTGAAECAPPKAKPSKTGSVSVLNAACDDLAQTGAIVKFTVTQNSFVFDDVRGPRTVSAVVDAEFHLGGIGTNSSTPDTFSLETLSGPMPGGEVALGAHTPVIREGETYVAFLRTTSWYESPVLGDRIYRVDQLDGSDILVTQDGMVLLNMKGITVAARQTFELERVGGDFIEKDPKGLNYDDALEVADLAASITHLVEVCELNGYNSTLGGGANLYPSTEWSVTEGLGDTP